MNAPLPFDVAIVGFGPAGAVAAGLLGKQGLRVFVCDKSHEVYELPRAFALDHEIMRVFQQLGIADAVLAFAEPFTPSEFFGVDGQLIKRFTTVEPPYPLGFVPSLVFSQPPVERILRAKVQTLPSVEVALGYELTGLQQDNTQATLQLRKVAAASDVRESGTTCEPGSGREIHARYVIGCDGATSTVRQAVGIALQDLGFDQAWLVADVLVNDQGAAKLPQTSVQYCEPTRPSTFLIGPKNHRRWEISINPGEDPKQVATPQGTWQLLSRWITPQDGTLWRQASYRFHALVADEWRKGRVFVAGDAAHQQPPFLGQGMCQGIRDVANLSWKLGAVLRGEAPAESLDTYGQERKAHVTELTARIKGIGQLVGERDIATARARDAHLLAECGGVVKSVPRQNVQPSLGGEGFSRVPHAANGTLFPQPWVMHGGQAHRLDDLAGTGWRLMVSSAAAHWPLKLPAWLHRVVLGGEWQERDGVVAQWWQEKGCLAAIVRPDHYVYGVASSALALQNDIDALSKQFFTHPPQREQVDAHANKTNQETA